MTDHHVSGVYHLESLKVKFVTRLLDFEVDSTDNLVLEHNLKPGNVRVQVEDGHVFVEDLIGVAPAVPSVDEEWTTNFDETFDKVVQQELSKDAEEKFAEERLVILTEAASTPRRITCSRPYQS